MNIAIIPARGGSKEVPNKNIRVIAGKPLIAWSIESALRAKFIDKVVVTTDSDEIASISMKFGAKVVRRPFQLATDDAPSESAIIHCLEQLNEPNVEFIVFRQCTSPLVLSDDIDNAICLARRNKNDSIFSVYREHFLGRWQNKSGRIVPINYSPDRRPMRKDIPIEFIENGAIYVFTPEVIKKGIRFGKELDVYIMPKERSLQVDTIEEFDFIEKILVNNLTNYACNKIDTTDIKLVIIDFDGTMTDNTVIVDQDGVESVKYNRSDGLGVRIMKGLGLEVICITSETNKVVKSRCSKLEIDVISSLDKKKALQNLLHKKNFTLQQCVFLGNDLNDLEVLKMVKYPIAVSDAHEKVRDVAKIILSKKGGEGTVLELAEILKNSQRRNNV